MPTEGIMSLFTFSLQPRGDCRLAILGYLREMQPAWGPRKWSPWVGLYLVLYVPSIQKKAQVRIRAGQISAGKFMHPSGFPQLWFPGLSRLGWAIQASDYRGGGHHGGGNSEPLQVSGIVSSLVGIMGHRSLWCCGAGVSHLDLSQ